jgi:predicted outer membrane repeat protein
MKKITILTICLTLFLTGSLYSKTVWVSFAGAGVKNGTSEADAYDKAAFPTALAEITTAGDILRVVGAFAPGSNTLAKTFAYTIEGDAGGSTFIGVTGVGRMFTINGASVGQNVTFKNITFSGQISSIAAGGAVLFSNQAGVTINFEKCRFVGNSLTSVVTVGGGALNITNSTVTITDCLFKENQALQNGGAIAIYNTSNVTMTGCTFYKNSTTNTSTASGATFGGGVLYVTGAAASVTINKSTFFENFIPHANQDYGTIRSDNGNTTINNSLFYNNKVTNLSATPPVLAGPSDWGAAALGTQTFNKSIGQWITSNIDVVTNSKTFVKGGLDPLAAANLTSSNLTYNDVLGKVTYNATITAGETSPKDFVSSGVDAGAWTYDSAFDPSLSVTDTEIAADFSVSYDSKTKNLKVLRSNDDSVSLEIYNLMGSKVLSRTNASKEENINASALQSGVYILVVKSSESKSFAKKFVIN